MNNLLEYAIEKGTHTHLNIDSLQGVHPKNVVCDFEIPLVAYEVTYSYAIKRGEAIRGGKKGTKIFIFNSYNPQINMAKNLEKWVEKFNKQYPYRALLNVKILSSKCLGLIILNE